MKRALRHPRTCNSNTHSPSLAAFPINSPAAPDFSVVATTGLLSLLANNVHSHALAQILMEMNVVFFLCLAAKTVVHLLDFRTTSLSDQVSDWKKWLVPAIGATSILGLELLVQAKELFFGQCLVVTSIILLVALAFQSVESLANELETAQTRAPRLLGSAWSVGCTVTMLVAWCAANYATTLTRVEIPTLLFAITLYVFAVGLYAWLLALNIYRTVLFKSSVDTQSTDRFHDVGVMSTASFVGANIAMHCSNSLLFMPFCNLFVAIGAGLFVAAGWWLRTAVMQRLMRTNSGCITQNYFTWTTVYGVVSMNFALFSLGALACNGVVINVSQVMFYLSAALWLTTVIHSLALQLFELTNAISRFRRSLAS